MLIHDDGLALAICEAGGPAIQQESNEILKKFGEKFIPTGNIILTTGGNMPCKKVIHAIGPLYRDVGFEKPLLLKKTIGNSLKLASALKFESIAFPALCTGLYKYPDAIVSRLLFDEVMMFARHLPSGNTLTDIRFIDCHKTSIRNLT